MGLEEMACPDKPQNPLAGLARSLKASLSTSTPKIPGILVEKAPKPKVLRLC